MSEPVGEFVHNKKDFIGHGAFAVVFKGHHKKVTSTALRRRENFFDRSLSDAIRLWPSNFPSVIFF